MKKYSIYICLLILTTAYCSKKTIEGTGPGYISPITVKLSMSEGQIIDLDIIENDTSYISKRAIPIIKERILTANSPVVDNVSGASYTSFGVKLAVANALKKMGKDVEKITLTTKAPEQEPIESPDVQTDIIVIGGGPAGLTAAISAKENNTTANVILVEKLDILSGNGKSDRTFYDLVNTEAQKKANIEDSADKFYGDLVKRSKEVNPDLDRMRAYADGSATLDPWLRDHNIALDYVLKRTHQAKSNSFAGVYIQDNLEIAAKKVGIDIRTGTKAIDLFVEAGVVKGIRVQKGNQTYNIYGKAVIVATGGFSHNKDYIKKYAPQYKDLLTSNSKGATGSFISLFEKNNIALTNMGVINVYPIISDRTRELISTEDYILVNQEGLRTFNETTTFTDRNNSVSNILAQTGQKMYLIYDEADRKDSYRIAYQEAHGIAIKGNTVQELADKLKMTSSEGLQNTFDKYNKIVKGETVDPFGRTTFRNGFEKGPYYAISVKPGIHMTRGGVLATAKAEVLHNDKTLVKGLYAAGEVANILDGAYVAAVVFGRVAGIEAAQYIQNN